MDAVADFVTQLAMHPRVPLAFNMYFDYDDAFDPVGAPTMRQKALAQFLEEHRGAKYALIGLAPGYAGARFSGIPFVDENHLTARTGVRYSLREQPWAEASATVVHDTLARLGITDDTVMWNTMPFHPFRQGQPMSNRTPTTDEIRTHGKLWLARFLEMMSPGIVVPVGRAAERVLAELRSEGAWRVSEYVRHPAYGGDTEFARGLLTIVGREASG